MLNFYGEILRMLRNRLYDFVEDICKYNNFTHEKTEEIQYIMRVLMYEILKIFKKCRLHQTFENKPFGKK